MLTRSADFDLVFKTLTSVTPMERWWWWWWWWWWWDNGDNNNNNNNNNFN